MRCTLIYLDTHVVVWLYAGLVDNFNQHIRDLINENDTIISPIVRLELQFLFEIKRVTQEPDVIVSDLENRIGLQVCEQAFNTIIRQAMAYAWTRDPFDRLIVANAALGDHILISKDQKILSHYAHAVW